MSICRWLLVFLALPGLLWAEADGAYRIRRTAQAPFAQGKAVTAAWDRADVLTGFVVPEALDVPLDATEARFLFDDRNLYARIVCHRVDSERAAPDPSRLFRNNHVELFFAPDRQQGTFRQFAFSENGLTYLGRFESGGKMEVRRPRDLVLTIEHEANAWIVQATIPWKVAGIGAVKSARRLALLVARGNYSKNAPRESSASAALTVCDYSDTRQWGEAVLADDDGTPSVRVSGPTGGNQVNYLANPDFNVPGRGWEVVGKGLTVRQETMHMSGEWIYRTTGDSYQFLKTVPMDYRPDTEYTLAVTARAFGREAVMNVLELYRRSLDGETKEGAHVADGVVLGPEFQTHYFTFRSAPENPLCLLFYKIEPKNAPDAGIDVAAIRLYRGRTSPLQIRKIFRTARKEAVAGTEVPLPKNLHGATRSGGRALVFARRYRDLREVAEPFAGLGIEADVLVTLAPGQDSFETDSDPKAVLKRLNDHAYDLFVLPSGTPQRIGKAMAAQIEAGVKAGAGLYLMHPRGEHPLAPFVQSLQLQPLDDGHPLTTAFPFPDMEKQWTDFDPSVNLGEAVCGTGKVLVENRVRSGDLLIRRINSRYGRDDFPLDQLALAWMGKAFCYLARSHAAPAPAIKTQWRVLDRGGKLRGRGTADTLEKAWSAAEQAPSTSGKHVVLLRTVDGEGFTVDWQVRALTRPGPIISSLETLRASCDGDEPALLKASIEGDEPGLSLRWTLADFSGRILESGVATNEVPFAVPTRALYTNLGIVRLTLLDGKTVRDTRRAEVFARDRDRARLFDDFTVGVWGHRNSGSRITYPLIDRQLERIGVRHQLLPITGDTIPFSMQGGMAVGGGYLGNSDWLIAHNLDETNIRKVGAINTEGGRARLAQTARKTAREAAPYGVTEYTACDEPNLAQRFVRDEPDETPENVEVYRQRQCEKYRTIDAYNARHRTHHAAFSDLKPCRLAEARKTGNFAEYVEWRNFNVDRWCEVMKLLADEGKAEDPQCRMSLFESFGQTAASGNDYWKLLTRAGLGFSNEYTAMVSMGRDAIYNFDEFYRSFRPDLRVWGFTGYGIGKMQIDFTPWWFAAHRYGGFSWFSTFGWGWHLVDSPTLALTRDADDIRQAMESTGLMRGLGKLLLAYDWAPRTAAIYYSHESMLVATLLGKETLSYTIDPKGPLHDYHYSRQGAQYLLEDLLYQHDFVAPEQVLGGALKSRRLLVMPRIIALSDAEVTALKVFLAAGGRILADVLPGDYDELGVRRAQNPFVGSGIEVWGENFDDLSVKQRTQLLARLGEAGVKPVLRSAGIEKVFGREAMQFTDGVNSIYMVLRMPSRSTDAEEQTFVFAPRGRVHDLVANRDLGSVSQVRLSVPRAGAAVWSVMPYAVKGLSVAAPTQVTAGTDLVAGLSLEATGAKIGTHVFHVELVPPSGACRFHLQRNLLAPKGRAELRVRLAQNDPPGPWTLRVFDPLSGTTVEQPFVVAR